MFHACTDLKYIFLGFVCRKGITFTKKIHIYFAFWWFLEMVGGKAILGILFWFSDLLHMVFLVLCVSLSHRWPLLY